MSDVASLEITETVTADAEQPPPTAADDADSLLTDSQVSPAAVEDPGTAHPMLSRGEEEHRPPDSAGASTGPAPIGFLSNVEVPAAVELGRVVMSIGEVLSLGPGSVVHLDKMLGDPVDLVIRDRLIARGEVVVVDDKFGLRITEIICREGV